MNTAKNIEFLKGQIAPEIKLIAVSKFQPNYKILEAYNAGQKAFGENYVQELIEKRDQLPADIEWHFIGHLQSNKVKSVAPFVDWIHGVDSLKLLDTIDLAAEKNNRNIKCLLQVHVSEEETKYGLDASDLLALCAHIKKSVPRHISVCGLMGMASFTTDQAQIRKEFQEIKNLFERVKREFFNDDQRFREISMGMSSDWQIAIEEGSTMVRIGSAIFGDRKK